MSAAKRTVVGRPQGRLRCGGAPPETVGMDANGGPPGPSRRQPEVTLRSEEMSRAAARTLAFVARRLRAEAVGIVFAVRESIEPLRGLPELLIPGLDGDAARGVLASVPRAAVDERILERFIAETGGNPLALLELSQGLTADDPGGSGGLRESDSRGVWVVREESFHRRPTSALEGGGSGRRPAPCRRRAAGSRAAARRRHGRVPSSAGPVRDVPVGIPERATPRASRACGGDGPGGRSRPSSLAPSSCGTRT